MYNLMADCPWKWEDLRTLCKHEGVSCSGTKAEMCKRLAGHLGELEEKDKTVKARKSPKKVAENVSDPKIGFYAPEKYFAGLTHAQRKKRVAEIASRRKKASDDPSAYGKFSTDYDEKGKRIPTKRSTYTTAFYEKFPSAKSLEEKADATGVPLDILKKIYNKGLAAWRTGHRPGATQGQWGIARVHSFLMKGCTYYSPDHKEVAEAKKRSKKAQAHWKSVSCICKKVC